MKNLLKTTILAAILFLAGCKKEKGPKGDPGINGVNGINGVSGIKDQLIIIKSNQWSYIYIDKEFHYNYYFNTSTNDQIDDRSQILCYVSSGNGDQAMPYVDNYYNFRLTFAKNLYRTPPYVQIQFTNFTNNAVPPSEDFLVNIITIPPAMIKPKVNLNNYSDVKEAYGLN